MMADNTAQGVQLRDLGMLLRKDFGENVIVESFTVDFLTKPGENYGSTMLKVDAVIRRSATSRSENLHAVAKMVPSSEFFKEIFNSPLTFRKEIAMYEEIVPTYRQLQKENNVDEENFLDILPHCYGARMKLSSELDFDDHAAILMENLRLADYSCGDRKEGLDLTHCKLVMRNLAKFHALGVAVKMIKPETFEKFKTIAVAIPPLPDLIESVNNDFKNTLMNNPKLIKHWPRLEHVTKKAASIFIDPPGEPFGTLCHADFWVNNMMFHYNADGQPDKMKIVDFQHYCYQSPVRDLIFFLIASTTDNVRKNYIDDMINEYYDHFVETLRELSCDVSNFSRYCFDREIMKWSYAAFIQNYFMLKVILLPDNQVKDTSEMNLNSFEEIKYDGYDERLEETIELFFSKGWI